MRIYCLTVTIISTRIYELRRDASLLVGGQRPVIHYFYKIKHNIIVGTFNGQRSALDQQAHSNIINYNI